MSIISGGSVTGAAAAYQIERSLRFNSADSAYLNRTPASAGNRKTFTISYWIKRSALGSTQYLFAAGSGTTESTWFSNALDIATVQDQIGTATWTSSGGYTNAVLRDPSAWAHIVIAIDTTQATAANRSKLYINNVLQTFTGAVTLTQNADLAWNNASVVHYIGARVDSGPRMFFDGYLTEIYNIDGQALNPSDFGETDSATGVWKPKKFSGTYGTNGFYLKFADNSNTTSTTLGKDSSGNGNNWTPNNFSVTAGAGNDSLVDTPTSYGTDTGAGGEVRGNYPTWNPLAVNPAACTFANGNLDVTTAGVGGNAFGTFAIPSSGKWYWEVVCTTGNNQLIGIAAYSSSTTYGFQNTNAVGYYVNGQKYVDAVGSAYGSSYTTQIIGVAADADAGTITFYRDNVSQGSITHAVAGLFPTVSDGASATTDTFVANFGQRPFAYTAPSGFKALCTQNLPTPTIGATSTTQANDYFDVKLWSGNSSTQSIALEFAPGLIWNKSRGDGAGHSWWDVLRGTGAQISSNQTDAESTGYNAITSFSNNAISLGVDNTGTYNGRTNETGRTYVGWVWKANGAGSSNTAGSISSTVSANTTAGFSIVTWTGNSSNATIGHGLGVAPSMYIIKYRGTTDSWYVYHTSTGTNKYLVLNSTDLAQTNTNIWQNTAPTSTVFSIGFSNNASTIVAYCFAAVAGYSAFGSYTGNGSTDGPFVYTGFRPRWVLIKETGNANSWELLDTARNPYNAADKRLFPNDSLAEATTADTLDIISNGFKPRVSNTGVNRSGGTYIYAAFAESPFKYSLAR